MCTVLLRVRPGTGWPVLLAAIRDEFVDRAWDPPARHWPGAFGRLVGGRDRAAGGTWLAVDPDRPAVAAVLNGVRLPPGPTGTRPSRGALPLQVLGGQFDATGDFSTYDGFHLVSADLAGATVWSWDGQALTTRELSPGDHIIVNLGVDAAEDPLVPHFLPLLTRTGDPDPRPAADPRPATAPRAVPGPRPEPRPSVSTAAAWGPWLDLVGGDGLDPADERALLIRQVHDGKVYGSTSATLVALGADPGAQVRYDFCADPVGKAPWEQIH